MTHDVWLAIHPYLQPLATLRAVVQAAIFEVSIPGSPVAEWGSYTGDFQMGVPLLQSSWAAFDFETAGQMIVLLIERLASSSSPGTPADESRTLHAELCRNTDTARRALAWLLDQETFACSFPGLLRYLGWTALEVFLRPLRTAFDQWRDEERWLRGYCPLCGSLPAMAQLVGSDSGRRRLLSCGRCATRWRYQRMECPFCQRQNHQLSVLTIDGEGGLRIDHCESCNGYLKTYDGEGGEQVLLADWTSIHLDLIAQECGLKRLAISLYEL